MIGRSPCVCISVALRCSVSYHSLAEFKRASRTRFCIVISETFASHLQRMVRRRKSVMNIPRMCPDAALR